MKLIILTDREIRTLTYWYGEVQIPIQRDVKLARKLGIWEGANTRSVPLPGTRMIDEE